MEIKNYTVSEIFKYVTEKYPKSCIVENMDKSPNISNKCINFNDENIYIKELDDFFTYEIIGFCSCGAPTDCKKDILFLLDIFYNDITHPNKIVERIYDNSLLLFIVYMLNDKGLLKHESNIRESRISDFGNMCRIIYSKSLRRE